MTNYSTWAFLDLVKEESKLQWILDCNPLNATARNLLIQIRKELDSRPKTQD